MQDKKSAEILAIDDTPANLEVITETLSSAGYAIAAATSGKRALKRLQTYIPDLILLDVKMPEIDGFEICRQIKENPNTAGIPIIFITALSDSESITKGFSLGAVDYITKPFQELELLARVQTHLKLRSLNESLEKQVAERTRDLERTMGQLQEALTQVKTSQLQLIQKEKMAALGNTIAGVAHEINNPLGFLSGSINITNEHFQGLVRHLQLYQQCYPEPEIDILDHAKKLDLPFVLQDVPDLLETMKYGIDRLKDISNSLRIFSRIDADLQFGVNLHEGLESTLLILKYRLQANQFRPAIQVVREYRNLPEISCFLGQINQVFTNILANAIDMFDEMAEQKSHDRVAENPPKITIRTFSLGDRVRIEIQDNGTGMQESVKAQIFDASFTTKAAGKGTGLGLAIARQIIAEKHGGEITCDSTLGQGTTFSIVLPIA